MWLRQLAAAWRRLADRHDEPLFRAWATIRPEAWPEAHRTLGAWLWTQAAHAMSRRRLERTLRVLGDDARPVIDALSGRTEPTLNAALRRAWAEALAATARDDGPAAIGPAACGQRLLGACIARLDEPDEQLAAAVVLGVPRPAKTAAGWPLGEDGWRSWNLRLARILQAAGDTAAIIEDRDAGTGRSESVATCSRRAGHGRAAVSNDASAAGDDRGSRAVASGPARGGRTGPTRSPGSTRTGRGDPA